MFLSTIQSNTQRVAALLVLIATMTSLSACDNLDMQKQDDPGQPAAGTKATATENRASVDSKDFESSLKVNIVAGEPEKYTVQFSWPSLEDKKILRIRLNSVLTEIKPEQTFFTHQVAHNQILNYSFDVLDQNRKLENTVVKSVKIPMDYVVREGTAELPNAFAPVLKKQAPDKFDANKSENLEFIKIDANRLFLSQNFALITNSYNLEITVNEIHSTLGLIQSLPALIAERPPTADFGQAGRSAGSLSITAKKLFGNLHITMRGEHGGKGLQGPETGGRGPSGSQAGAGVNNCESGCVRCTQEDLKMNKQNPTEFFKYITVKTQDSHDVVIQRCNCDSYGSRGGDGGRGLAGAKGLQGMPGGDAGKVRILIEEIVKAENTDLQTPGEQELIPVSIEQIPGLGGEGGAGGPGQLGGTGGGRSNEACSGDPGNEGPRGSPGPSGDTGFMGKSGQKCIYIGSENVNECQQ